MNRLVLVMVLAALFPVLLTGCLSCAPEVDLPPHAISYTPGSLKGDEGRARVLELQEIDLSPYPDLKLREGFSLKRAVYKRSGGDMIGFAVAIDQPSRQGFAIETMNGVQGGFLFAPISNGNQALQYAMFMVHETPETCYLREHEYIHTQDAFDTALSSLQEYTIAGDPPAKITRVTEESDGSYLVELVCICRLYQQRMEYFACRVSSDGSIELKENYIFIEGPPGMVL